MMFPQREVLMRRSMNAAIAACALCAFATGPAGADRVVLSFEGSAYGFIPLGRAALDVSIDPDSYEARAQIQSGGLSALFDRTDLSAVAAGEAQGVLWRRYDLDHSYAKKHRKVALQSTPAGIVADIRPMFRVSINPPTEADKAGARDPVSSLVAMGVAVGRTGNCAGTYPTFDGRFRYDLILRVEGRDRHRGGGYDGDVLKCKLRYRPVSGYDTPGAMSKRIPEGEIWFALDGGQIAAPIRVTAPLPLGHAAIKLATYTRPRVEVVDVAPRP
jgi:hypothetical protein